MKQKMTACWRYGVLFSNSFLVFGVYYFLQIPVALQSDIMYSYRSNTGYNNTESQVNCNACLGLGEFRYNLLFSISRWTSVVTSLPLGFLIDRLGNARSALSLSILSVFGSILFTLGSMSHAPVTYPMYMLMMTGYSLVTLADGPLRFVQTRVIACAFPEATSTSLAFGMIGLSGQAVSMFASPNFANVIGPIPAIWLGVSLCGIGVVCAVVLSYLLQYKPYDLVEVNQNNITLTLRAIPGTYWMHILAYGFTLGSWIYKQENLPDYLELRHGYTMTEASYIAGIAPLVYLFTPLFSFVQKKIDCDGIMITFFMAWMVPLYAFLGFCPAFNVYVISVADGIGITIVTVLAMQLLVVMCPAAYVGTLAGVMFLVRNAIPALTFVAAGYILETHSLADIEEALGGYHYFFLMLIITSSTAVVCGIIMNILDTRQERALNSRIRRWRKSNIEAMELMSMEQPPQYSDIGDGKRGRIE